MKHLRKFKKNISLFLVTVFLSACSSTGYTAPETAVMAPPLPPPQADTIKIALLLDTSSSMNGLLEQAKSQLWKIVNELAMAKKNNVHAQLEIALYQYGNDGLNGEEGYIENVLPLSSDLDDLSEKLFALSTNGGDEYCGQVIQTATNQLNWNEEVDGLNLVFIAGNEPFNQGEVDYKIACQNALEKGITINTIFCGDYQNGISTEWLSGAQLTEGNYMNIDMNQKTVYIETPYDAEIANLSSDLNATYIAYGYLGKAKKESQITQDGNAEVYGIANSVSRTVSKSSHLYSNSSWDLVDATDNKNFDIEKIDAKTLPSEMQGLNTEEKLAYIEKMALKREQIQAQIQALNRKRLDYIASVQTESSTSSFNGAMLNAIKKQARRKGFTFDNEIVLEKEIPYTKAYVDFDYFEKVAKEAKEHRKSRLINFETFINYSKESNTIILDTRSKRMYDRMHIKGAVHINFSDFTQAYLSEIIPDTNTRILIYCNNNFKQEQVFVEVFVTKMVLPASMKSSSAIQQTPVNTMALNIPTYINLFGYNYKNVYELSELVSTKHESLEIEGTDAKKYNQLILGK